MLWRVQGSGPPTNPTEIYTYFNGLQTSDVGNDGPAQTDYATAINARTAAAQTSSPFKAGHAVPYANTDEGYDPLNPTAGGEAATGEIYVTRDGDTLRTIALLFWGDESLWYILADANGLTGTEALAAGQRIIVPSKVVNVHNKNSTFRVYDPNQALGDIQPNQPKPPKHKHGCGTIGKILVAVVAVVVTLWVTQNLQTALKVGKMVAGAAGAAAGSVASQGVGIALGVQDRFSWNGVALAAIGGGIAASLSGVNVFGQGKTLTTVANGAARQALGNALTQGVGIATGLQRKFDWTGVAVAAVVGGTMAGLGPILPGAGASARSAAGLLNSGLTGAAGAVAGAAARSLLTGTDFGDNITAVLPDVIGSTIGNAIAGQIGSRPKLTQQQLDEAATQGIQGAVVRDRDLTIDDILAGVKFKEGLTAANAASSMSGAAAMREKSVRTYLNELATTPNEQQTVNDFYRELYPHSSVGDFDPKAVTVTGDPNKLNYFASQTIDNAGIWVGNKVDALQGGVSEFLRQNPAANLAVNVASVGLTIAGGPVRYVSGLAWEKASTVIEGGITKGYSSAGWGGADAAAGGKGVTFTGSLLLGGAGALKAGVVALPTVGKAVERSAATAAELPSGSFSISDWSGYPAGVPRPQGPVRIVEGAEYNAAREASNKANATIRREQGLVGQPVDVHEIKPVKFGGSPTASDNKVVLPRDVHRQQVTPWWNQLQKDLGF